jgi:cell fate regulator YaaT (PSP1 superfamily)
MSRRKERNTSNTNPTDGTDESEQIDADGNGYLRVKVIHSSETEVCRTDGTAKAKPGEYVILPTRYGKDLGLVLGPTQVCAKERRNTLQAIDRVATEKDLQAFARNREREAEAFGICQKKIEEYGLDMKLVSAHYLLDEPKVLFFFTAENRVDFRELVKALVSVFRMRIELRQIGVRDESRVLGGLGVCGRDYCCHGLTDKLSPVSIKMAKEQNLSLNSMKISGPCGRLLCCLAYEYEFYKEEKRSLPNEGSRIYHGDDQFKIVEMNILSRSMKLIAKDGRTLILPLCKAQYNRDESRWELAEIEAN